jgi:hypothetical protein
MALEIAAVESLRARILRILESRPINDPYIDVIGLFDMPEIRELTNDRNKVSIMLSDMFRTKSMPVTRLPSGKKGNVKYVYASSKVVADSPKALPKAERIEPKTITVSPTTDTNAPTEVKKAKPSITVTEDKVTIETESIRIVIEI